MERNIWVEEGESYADCEEVLLEDGRRQRGMEIEDPKLCERVAIIVLSLLEVDT